MSNSNRGRRTPYVRPVQRVEISEGNVKLRMILIVVLLALAVVAIVTGLSAVLRTEPGWQRVDVESIKTHCGDDFVLDYDFTDDGSGATAKFKELTRIYSAACEDAFLMFSVDVESTGAANMHGINKQPNEVLTVDPALYNALSLMQRYHSRSIYLGGIFAEYGRIMSAETDVEAASYDPRQDTEQMAYIAELAAYANDPAMVDLQLLGENQVKLQVADAYLAFAARNEIDTFVDFGWMKNAFIADYLAQTLSDNGFTSGYLASFDGFTRNLDKRGNAYSQNVFDRRGRDIYLPATLSYTAPASIVFLRDYPMGKADVWNYHAFDDGRIASMMIDPVDGLDKASVDSLLCYSADQSCAELLLQVAPVLICDEFRASELQSLASDGIHSIWCEETTVHYTEEQVDLTLQPQEEQSYTKVFAG